MSYDIAFGVETVCANNDGENFVEIGYPKLDSPTYNLRDMFVAACDWNFEQRKWYKLEDVLPNISRGIFELTNNRTAYEKYSPKNGFGNIDDAIAVLQSMVEWVEEHKSSLYLWPTEALWIRW